MSLLLPLPGILSPSREPGVSRNFSQAGTMGGRAARGTEARDLPLDFGRRFVVLTALWEPSWWSFHGLCSPVKLTWWSTSWSFCAHGWGRVMQGVPHSARLQLSRRCLDSLFSLLWPQFPQVSKVDTSVQSLPWGYTVTQ